MKKSILTASTIALFAFGAHAEGELSAKLSKLTECREVSAAVTSALTAVGGKSAKIEDVKPIVSQSLEAQPSCACEITTASIVATGANRKDHAAMLEAIVETAFITLPDSTSEIAECAVAAAPNHSALIEKTLVRVFSENENKYQGGTSTKATSYSSKGKPAPPARQDYAEPVAPIPAPIYLIAPGAGGFVPVPKPVSPGAIRPEPYYGS